MHGRIVRYVGCLAVLLFLMAQPLSAIKVPRGLDNCPSLQACLKILDRVVPAYDDGEGSNGDVLANKLRRFGDPAKHELLKRATGDHPGWRNVAGAILSEWRSWTPSDVPELREALRKDPGGWVARPLGEIGTPDAIQALVDDLPNGSESQTGFALSDLGARAIPYLLPVLKSDENAESAAHVIRDMGATAIPFANRWAALAADPQKPVKERIGALRGIAAIGDKARPACGGLHGLLSDSNPGLRKQADFTLNAVHDPVVAGEVAESCRPGAAPFDPFAMGAFACLQDVASYGDGGRQVGGELLPFLSSKNGAERSYAVTALGSIGYGPAIPQIENALNSGDWRVVYAAIQSLGWLGDTAAIPDMKRIASDHWLSEVRKKAAQVAAALSSLKGGASRPLRLGSAESDTAPFMIDHEVLGKAPSCASDRWRWKGTSFRIPARSEDRASSLRFRDGELVRTNHGEWGGQLAWLPGAGQSVTLLRDSVIGMEYDQEDAIALFGLAHMSLDYGYVLRISRAPDGAWSLTEAARLPGTATGWTTLGPNLFAAKSAGRVIVFSSKLGILGSATCESP